MNKPKILKNIKSLLSILFLITISFLILPMGLYSTVFIGFGGYTESPDGHIRNNNYVIGKYVRSGSIINSSPFVRLTVTNLNSYFRYERDLLMVGPKNHIAIDSYGFSDEHTLTINLSDARILMIDLSEDPGYTKIFESKYD